MLVVRGVWFRNFFSKPDTPRKFNRKAPENWPFAQKGKAIVFQPSWLSEVFAVKFLVCMGYLVVFCIHVWYIISFPAHLSFKALQKHQQHVGKCTSLMDTYMP